jgi:aromatic ring-opening dioxygenase catalytic subunit (LigB family)
MLLFLVPILVCLTGYLYLWLRSEMTSSSLAPALFVSHGGGPLPLMNVADHGQLTEFLNKEAPNHLRLNASGGDKPKALVVITAHWETSVPTVSTRTNSELLFDYYGFPQETYNYTYNAKGSTEIASRVIEAIRQGGFSSVKEDPIRGWDHGVFVPLLLISPSGLDIPLIVMSCLQSQDPNELVKLGQALAPLREEGIAFLGSGFTFHNFAGFRADALRKQKFREAGILFEEALNQALTGPLPGLPENEERERRIAAIANWQSLPYANTVQPAGGQEHFSPLVILAGMLAEGKAERAKLIEVSGFQASLWLF